MSGFDRERFTRMELAKTLGIGQCSAQWLLMGLLALGMVKRSKINLRRGFRFIYALHCQDAIAKQRLAWYRRFLSREREVER